MYFRIKVKWTVVSIYWGDFYGGPPFFYPASGGTGIFLACGQGGAGKILTASKGGSEFFFALHLTKSSQKGLKNTFLHVSGGFSPLCVSCRTIIRRGGPGLFLAAFRWRSPVPPRRKLWMLPSSILVTTITINCISLIQHIPQFSAFFNVSISQTITLIWKLVKLCCRFELFYCTHHL